MILAGNPNPECEMNPNDPTCGTNTSSGYTEAKFLVVYARSGTADYWRVTANEDEFKIEALPTQGVVDGVAAKFQQLNAMYLTMLDTYTLTQQQDGRFVNELDQFMEDIAPLNANGDKNRKFTTLSQRESLQIQAPCSTALSYSLNGQCRLALNHWLRTMNQSNQEALLESKKVFSDVDFNLAFLISELQKPTHSFNKAFHFKDNSVLVLTLKRQHNNAITLDIFENVDAGRTSQGNTISAYFSQRFSAAGVKMSGAETLSYLTYAQCGMTNFLNVDKNFQVTTIPSSDGEATITAIQQNEQHTVPSEQLNCKGVSGSL